MRRGFFVALVAVVGGAWALVLVASGEKIGSAFFRPFSIVVTTTYAAAVLFDRLIWRLPLVNRLAARPCLRGAWEGILVPRSARGKNRMAGRSIPIAVAIEQTFSTIAVRLRTRESGSVSLAAQLHREPDGSWMLATTYRNDPDLSVRKRSPIHYGATLLSLGGDPPDAMKGHYWTDRDTKGDIDLRRVSTHRRG